MNQHSTPQPRYRGLGRVWQCIRGLLGPSRKTTRPSAPSSSDPGETLKRIKAHGWQQGFLLPLEAHRPISEITGAKVDRDSACIVVSQSCCLHHGNFEAEPSAEILIARPIPEKNGNCIGAKSIRKLHGDMQSHGKLLHFEVTALDRYFIPREMLGQYAPDGARFLPNSETRSLVAWLIARYDREAFPDSFNDRIPRNIREKLSKQFDKVGEVSDVLISLNTTKELSKAEPYQVKLIFVMPNKHGDDPDARLRAEKVLRNVCELLSQCEGIEVIDDELSPVREVTLDIFDEYRRWGDFEYLTFRGSEFHEVPRS